MKKQLLMKSLVLLCALVVGSTHVWATDPVATATAANGKSYVVAYYANNKYYALPQGTSASVWTATEVTLNSINKVNSTTAASLAWTFTAGSTSGQFYLTYTKSNTTYYLFKNGTGNTNYNIKGSTNSNDRNYWQFALNSGNNDYTISAVDRGTNNLYLGYNGSSNIGKFGVYAQTNAAKIILLEIGDATSYTITTAVNDENMGSVNLSGTTITATPNSGYRVKAGDEGYTVTSGTATVTNNGDNTFTVDATSNCTVRINFETIPTHQVTFNVNGTPTNQSFAEGATIVFPNPEDVYGKTCVGWVISTIDGTTNTAPTFVSSATMGTSDLTYYAVFAKKLSVTQTYTVNTGTQGFPTSYSDGTDYTFGGIQFNVHQMMYNSSENRIQFKTSAGKIYNKTPLYKIQSIVLTYTSADNYKNCTLKVGNTENPTEGTTITPSSSGVVYTFDTSENDYNYFLLANGTNAGYASSIAITYYGYNAYCTTVTNKQAAALSYEVSSYKLAPNIIFTPALTNPHSLTVTYASDDVDIVAVDENTGEILTGDKIGTATITASFAGNANYDEGTATYTITTYDPTANDGSEAKPYTVAEALTKIAALADNGTIPSVYVKGKVHEVTSYNSTYKSITYYIEDLDDNTKTLYVYGGKGLGNTDFTAETDLTVGDEVMIYGALQKYVKNSTTTPEFTSNNYIAQYKHGTDAEVKSLQVKAAEYATYVASANLIVPAGVKAYIATGETSTELTLKSVAKIKNGTPVILNASEGYYSFEITDEAVDYGTDTNLLKISNGTAVNGVFVLAKDGSNVGFFKWTGGALSPGRVYVDAPSSSARDYLEFVFEETTAIETVKTQKIDSQYYNLAGQRVAQPTKGLYIVNGKKLIIK